MHLRQQIRLLALTQETMPSLAIKTKSSMDKIN